MKAKIDIISGFLGAGKTTLIKKLLEEKLSHEKLVIIENEFGEVGIDGSILKNSGIEVKEINSGCICCTLVGDFGKAIEEVLIKHTPDRVIIEPSGVGKLSDIIKACNAPQLKELLTINMLIAVVDVLKYQIYLSNFGEFFENQITHAKTVVLSRTQRIDNAGLESVVNSIRSLNAKAHIITTPWETLPAERILSVAEQDISVSLEHQLRDDTKIAKMLPMHQKNCDCGCNHEHSHNHSADAFFDVWGVETPKMFEQEELSSKLHDLGNEKVLGRILRGKGILQTDNNTWVQFDYVPGECDVKPSAADYTGRLCIIGKDLNTIELCRLFGISA